MKVEANKEYIFKMLEGEEDVFMLTGKFLCELVRCKDCEHWKKKNYCRKIQLNGFEDPEFYCGYGVRK